MTYRPWRPGRATALTIGLLLASCSNHSSASVQTAPASAGAPSPNTFVATTTGDAPPARVATIVSTAATAVATPTGQTTTTVALRTSEIDQALADLDAQLADLDRQLQDLSAEITTPETDPSK